MDLMWAAEHAPMLGSAVGRRLAGRLGGCVAPVFGAAGSAGRHAGLDIGRAARMVHVHDGARGTAAFNRNRGRHDRSLWSDAKIAAVLGLLPHRYPFLMLDRVLELTADRVVAIKNVTANEPYFAAPSLGVHLMPGVLQLEAIAQAGVLLAGHIGPFDPARHVFVLLTIDAARFRRPVVPGDQLRIEVTPQGKGSLLRLAGEIRVASAIASTARFVVRRVDRSQIT